MALRFSPGCCCTPKCAVQIAAADVPPDTGNHTQRLFAMGKPLPVEGSFTLSFEGATTNPFTPLPSDATAAQVQAALAALSTIGAGNIACIGGPLPASAITITLGGGLATSSQSLIGVTSNVACKCAQPTTLTVSFSDVWCQATDWSSSKVTVKRASDGWTATCTPSSSQFSWAASCVIAIPSDGGTFAVSVTTPIGSCSKSITIASCASATVGFERPKAAAVGCNLVTGPGAIHGMMVTFTTDCGEAICTTDSSGTCCPKVLASGQQTATFSKPPRWLDRTISGVGVALYGDAPVGDESPPVAPGYVCAFPCTEPIKKTLYITDPWGTTQLTYTDDRCVPPGGPPPFGWGAIAMPSPSWCGVSGYSVPPQPPQCPVDFGPITYALSNSSLYGGTTLWYWVTFDRDTLPQGVGGAFYTGSLLNVQCPDSATGTALLWTGTFPLCGNTIPFTITE